MCDTEGGILEYNPSRTMMMTARTTAMARTMTAVAVAFLSDRQQSTKRGSRRNGSGNGNNVGDGDSDYHNDGEEDSNDSEDNNNKGGNGDSGGSGVSASSSQGNVGCCSLLLVAWCLNTLGIIQICLGINFC